MSENLVELFVIPDDASSLTASDAVTLAVKRWLTQHEVAFTEHDGTTALGLILAQEHSVTEYPMVVVRDGDQVLDAYGGYHPDRLEQLLSPSL